MNSLAERLQHALKLSGKKPAQLAEAIGVSRQAIYHVLKGISKSFTAINNEDAAKFLGVSSRWLATGDGPIAIYTLRADVGFDDGFRTIEENDTDYVTVQAGTIRASAGVTGFAVDVENKPDKPIIFRRDWMQRRGYTASSLYAMKVSGRSMEPTLFDGDTVVVDTAHPAPVDGEVFLVNAGGEVVVKRLARRSGDWWMHSDNSNQSLFPPVRCDETCFIIGRIIHRQSETI